MAEGIRAVDPTSNVANRQSSGAPVSIVRTAVHATAADGIECARPSIAAPENAGQAAMAAAIAPSATPVSSPPPARPEPLKPLTPRPEKLSTLEFLIRAPIGLPLAFLGLLVGLFVGILLVAPFDGDPKAVLDACMAPANFILPRDRI